MYFQRPVLHSKAPRVSGTSMAATLDTLGIHHSTKSIQIPLVTLTLPGDVAASMHHSSSNGPICNIPTSFARHQLWSTASCMHRTVSVSWKRLTQGPDKLSGCKTIRSSVMTRHAAHQTEASPTGPTALTNGSSQFDHHTYSQLMHRRDKALTVLVVTEKSTSVTMLKPVTPAHLHPLSSKTL